LLLENPTQGFNLGRWEEEPRLRCEPLGEFAGEVVTARAAEGINTGRQVLSRTVEEFLGAHRAQAAQSAGPW
jgi:hypothetical protein